MKLFLHILSSASLLAFAQAQCDPQFGFASYYGSNMVLQRPPARPRIWGYAPAVGQEVVVNLDSDSQIIRAPTVMGPAGRPIWEAVFSPIATEGPHIISIQVLGTTCVLTINNILMGDVYICSGQSNMEHRLDNIDDPQPDIADVVNYPKVRSFWAAHATASQPQHDLMSVSRGWAEPTPANMAPFSAVCWLFGKNLFVKYGRPIGLIETNWGGTRIEAWSSTDALDACWTSYPPGSGPNEATVLYNAMIHPFHPMPIFGAIWYQGESNADGSLAPQYSCMVKSMVADWRAKWSARNSEMDPVFPFGQVQLAPYNPGDVIGGFPNIRWYQTDSQGYAPNPTLDKIFIAVAVDLPDFNSPYGSIHPRYKRQIADRLALAAYSVAYGSTSDGIYQGPLPTEITLVDPNTVRINYGIPLQYGNTASIFEFCCSPSATDTCSAGSGIWAVSNFIESGTDSVSLANPCFSGQSVTGFRYLWRESPCPNLEACPIYSVENNLPAPPYIYNGPIQMGSPVILKNYN